VRTRTALVAVLAGAMVVPACSRGDDGIGKRIVVDDATTVSDMLVTSDSVWMVGGTGLVVRLDREGKERARWELGIAGSGSLWQVDGGVLFAGTYGYSLIDPATNQATALTSITPAGDAAPRVVAAEGDAVWVDEEQLRRRSLATWAVTAEHRSLGLLVDVELLADEVLVAYRTQGSEVVRLDRATGAELHVETFGDTPRDLVATEARFYFSASDGTIDSAALDGSGEASVRYPGRPEPGVALLWEAEGLALDEANDRLWVLDQPRSTLHAFSLSTGTFVGSWSLRGQPVTLVVVGAEVWVGNSDGSITRVRPDDLD
jgi:hypothetical protein